MFASLFEVIAKSSNSYIKYDSFLLKKKALKNLSFLRRLKISIKGTVGKNTRHFIATEDVYSVTRNAALDSNRLIHSRSFTRVTLV